MIDWSNGVAWSFNSPDSNPVESMSAGYIYLNATVTFPDTAPANPVVGIFTPAVRYDGHDALVAEGWMVPVLSTQGNSVTLQGVWSASPGPNQPPIDGQAGDVTFAVRMQDGTASRIVIGVSKFTP